MLNLASTKRKRMAGLHIYRASAGSGKTFRLAQEYLKLLFRDPFKYRHILAVTFTNKATGEMRDRILKSLSELADPDCKNPEHLKDLTDYTGMSESQVRRKADLLLGMLLHDYSRFSISTIDSFFQKVTRSFAYEMGLPSGFRVELKPEYIMNQAIDQLIMEMNRPEYRETKEWLLNFARENMEERSKWNIAGEIQSISKEIFNEQYQANARTLNSQIRDKNHLSKYKQTLRQIIKDTDTQLEEVGRKGLEIIARYNLDINKDFKGLSRTNVKVFQNLARLEKHMEIGKIETLLEDIDNWKRKDNSREINTAIEAAYNSGLKDLLTRAAELIKSRRRDYFTAKEIERELNSLGLVQDVYEKMNEICRTRNLFILAGTNHLLSGIIDNNDTPFIYEKTGTRYDHYMIDEFQDTSFLQYHNFYPLIKDSLAAGNDCLVVGDVKQSIYRWRNSDWSLLAEAVERDYRTYGVESMTLDTNWRSSAGVINFNNNFFSYAAEALQGKLNGEIPGDLIEDEEVRPYQTRISRAFADVCQLASPRGKALKGEVYIKALDTNEKDNYKDTALKQTVERIEQLLAQGYEASEIAVLVRRNEEGADVSEALLSGKYHSEGKALEVISNDSLLLGKSEAIRLLIGQLKLISSPDDPVSESFVRLYLLRNAADKKQSSGIENISEHMLGSAEEQLWQDYKENLFTLREKPVYELVERLTKLLPEELRIRDSVYLQTFMSICLDFINQESPDLNKFLDYWEMNGAGTSLSVPDNRNAIRVMTIHKSKGLEFRAVIIPFANWKFFEARKAGLIWVSPDKEPFNGLALVPIKVKKDLANTYFAKHYFNELLQYYVDNLNLAYVAFTRAKQSLNIICQIDSSKDKDKSDGYGDIGELLYKFIQNAGDSFDSSLLTFHSISEAELIPESVSKTKKYSKANREYIQTESRTVQLESWEDRTLIHLESENFFDNEDSSLLRGRVIHAIFENIREKNDVDRAIRRLVFEGMIGEEEKALYKDSIAEWLSHPTVTHWFDGSYEVKTEASILFKTEKRPDRIMIKGDKVVVVDYKFGRSMNPAHFRQVEQYMRLIRQMGYKNVEGYLWYAGMGNIRKVELS